MNTTVVATKDEAAFQTARRVNQSLTAGVEKRVLVWMADRAPAWVTSDGLTLLGLYGAGGIRTDVPAHAAGFAAGAATGFAAAGRRVGSRFRSGGGP